MSEPGTDVLVARLEEISLRATRCRSHAKLASSDTYSLCDLFVELAELQQAVLQAIHDVAQTIDPVGGARFLGLTDAEGKRGGRGV